MKKIKLEKGITLIALIITIVVLLILAVVTISAVQESDIIMHAEKAVEEHEKGKEKELITLAYSEYFMSKRTNPNATLEVEGAQVTGSEETGWEVTFDETNNTYEVDKDGNVEVAEELVISEQKDIGAISYLYVTQYNPNQPEIISVSGYNSDENNDGMIDDNPSQPASIDNTYFNIKNTFFEQDMPTEGNIPIKITLFDGTVLEGDDIILTKVEGDIAWEYETESPLLGIDKLYIGFRPNAEYKQYSKKEEINQYEESNEYHYMYVEGEVVVPFQKLEMLGKTLEFPFASSAVIGYNHATDEVYPLYKDSNNISKIIINFSDGTKKVYLKEQFGTELGFFEGAVVSMLSVPGLQLPVTSVIIEEDGIVTKYNVTDSTIVMHTRPGS